VCVGRTVGTTQQPNDTQPTQRTPPNMLFLTLGQAAKECGKQKSTILDAIRNGRLSAGKDDKNQWQIDPAELFRVYPAQQQAEPTTERNTTKTEHNICTTGSNTGKRADGTGKGAVNAEGAN